MKIIITEDMEYIKYERYGGNGIWFISYTSAPIPVSLRKKKNESNSD